MSRWLPLFWILFILILSIQLESPLKIKINDTKGFSAINAKPHLDIMASENHFIGTDSNKKVRDYILREFNKLGIQTEVFVGYCSTIFRNTHKKMAITENIIATIKGFDNSKSVVIAGHYDSVLSSPGAADDVHSVACMLEVARLLKQNEYKNDIQFLITDGEEMGLLGAKAYVENKDVETIGVLFNYEARGNSGAGIFFEWSEGNHWLVRELRKATHRPVTNSMAYEIYKRLPNDSDFTHFKQAGIQGINHAFIDGFSYYHNPADTPENINLNSVQHTGENMFLLANHFASLNLSIEHNKQDAIFFNFLGMLVIYPPIVDSVFLISIFILILFIIYYSKGNERFVKNIFFALLSIFSCIILVIGFNLLMSVTLFKLYPQYDVFYTGQFYNHKWYILCSVASAILCFHFCYFLFNKLTSRQSILIVASILLLSIGIWMHLNMPTASYIISFPLLAIVIQIFLSTIKLNPESFIFKIPILKNAILDLSSITKFKVDKISNLLRSTFVLAIWCPILITLFLAFSIKLLFVPAIISLGLILSSMSFYAQIWELTPVRYLGVVLFVSGFLIAHSQSEPNASRPLPSNMQYVYNIDQDKAYWITDNEQLNIGHGEELMDATPLELEMPYRKTVLASEADVKPEIAQPAVIMNSLKSNTRIIYNQSKSFRTMVYVEDPSKVEKLYLNGKPALSESQSNAFIADLYGMAQDSLVIELVKSDTVSTINVKVCTMFQGMPEHQEISNKALRTGDFTSFVQTIKI